MTEHTNSGVYSQTDVPGASEMIPLTSAIVEQAASDLRIAIRRDLMMRKFSSKTTYDLLENIIRDFPNNNVERRSRIKRMNRSKWFMARKHISSYNFHELEFSKQDEESLKEYRKLIKLVNPKKKKAEYDYLKAQITALESKMPKNVDGRDIQMSTGALLYFFGSQYGSLCCGKIDPSYIVENILKEETRGIYIPRARYENAKYLSREEKSENWVKKVYIPSYVKYFNAVKEGGY